MDGHLSIREAADRFGVPETTVHSKFHGTHSDRKGIKDTNVITLKQISKILPQPMIKRERYVFPCNITC